MFIDFRFDDSSAENVGWFVSDPDYKCFRTGSPPGNYYGQTKEKSLRLVGGAEYIFVLQVMEPSNNNNATPPSGSYNITTGGDILLASSNGEDGVFYNEETTAFTTPYC